MPDEMECTNIYIEVVNKFTKITAYWARNNCLLSFCQSTRRWRRRVDKRRHSPVRQPRILTLLSIILRLPARGVYAMWTAHVEPAVLSTCIQVVCVYGIPVNCVRSSYIHAYIVQVHSQTSHAAYSVILYWQTVNTCAHCSWYTREDTFTYQICYKYACYHNRV